MTRAQLSEKNVDVTCAISDALALCHPLFDAPMMALLTEALDASRSMSFYISRYTDSLQKTWAAEAERARLFADARAEREQEEQAQ